MKNATLGQIQKILSYLEKIPSRILQQAIELGLISDFCEADPKKVNRVELRRALHLPSLAEKTATHKVLIPALPEKKTQDCFQTTERYKFYCQNEGEVTWGNLSCNNRLGEFQAMHHRFNSRLPETQPASSEGMAYECPMNPHRGTLEFAQHIAGQRGNVDEVSALLIKNGNCFTLQEVEKILEMWFGPNGNRRLFDITTRGIWFFVQNAQGSVSVLHLEDSPMAGYSKGAVFVLRPLKDQYHFQFYGHEQFLIKEPCK